MSKQLTEHIDTIAAEYPAIKSEIKISGLKELNHIELLHKVLQMADKTALTLINGDMKAFLDQVERDMEKVAGLRWDDLIIRLEWCNEEKAIIKLMNQQDGPKATELKEVLESHAYKFSLNTVKTWID